MSQLINLWIFSLVVGHWPEGHRCILFPVIYSIWRETRRPIALWTRSAIDVEYLGDEDPISHKSFIATESASNRSICFALDPVVVPQREIDYFHNHSVSHILKATCLLALLQRRSMFNVGWVIWRHKRMPRSMPLPRCTSNSFCQLINAKLASNYIAFCDSKWNEIDLDLLCADTRQVVDQVVAGSSSPDRRHRIVVSCPSAQW